MRRLPTLRVQGEPALLPDGAIRRQSHYFIYRPRISATVRSHDGSVNVVPRLRAEDTEGS